MRKHNRSVCQTRQPVRGPPSSMTDTAQICRPICSPSHRASLNHLRFRVQFRTFRMAICMPSHRWLVLFISTTRTSIRDQIRAFVPFNFRRVVTCPLSIGHNRRSHQHLSSILLSWSRAMWRFLENHVRPVGRHHSVRILLIFRPPHQHHRCRPILLNPSTIIWVWEPLPAAIRC